MIRKALRVLQLRSRVRINGFVASELELGQSIYRMLSRREGS